MKRFSMKGKSKYWRVIVELTALLLVIIGISYAWFVQGDRLTTLVAVVPPDSITIAGPHGSQMLLLDLDYNLETDKAEGDSITIYRPICIKSTNPVHQLEIAHTTNINGLKFKIYPAVESKTKQEGTSQVVGKDGNNQDYYYSYDPSAAITGQYQNLREGTEEQPVATDIWHNKNYLSDDNVQELAEPIYWLADKCYDKAYAQEKGLTGVIIVDSTYNKQQEYDPQKDDYYNYYYTYYVIEITWSEKTKETDLFYILAQNIDES